MPSNYSKERFQLRFLQEGNVVLNTITLSTEFACDAYYYSDTFDSVNNTNSGHVLVFNETGYFYIVRRNGKKMLT